MENISLLKSRELANPSLKCDASPAHRVLVVDDERETLDLNVRILRDAGYDVEEAADGAAAWKNMQTKRYDLLVTDNSMPRLSGLELIGKVRTSGMALPVIMATGLVPEAQLARSPQCQPSAFLMKPYTASEFLTKVKNILCGDGVFNPPTLIVNTGY